MDAFDYKNQDQQGFLEIPSPVKEKSLQVYFKQNMTEDILLLFSY